MPPRLQCLNAPRCATKKCANRRAHFSTTRRALAEPPQNTGSLLEALGSFPTTRSPSSLPRTTPSRPSTHEFLDTLPLPTSSSPSTPPSPRPPPPSSTPPPPRESFNVLTSRVPDAFDASTKTLLGTLLHQKHTEQSKSATLPKYTPPTPTELGEKERKGFLAQDLAKAISRHWRTGDVYAPRDLGRTEMYRWSKGKEVRRDVFDLLRLEVEGEYKNFSIMSEYMTPMGRIKPIQDTCLRPVNQRKIAKAIRRSIGIGLMPSVHRHPEIVVPRNTTPKSNSRLGFKSAPIKSFF